MSSMNREQLGEWLSAYLDKELSAEESRRIEAILETDEEARRTLEELRRTASLVAALPSHGAPESVAENIRAQVERQALLGDSPTEAAPQRRRSPLRAVLSLAAVLAVIVSGLMYITLGQPLGGGRPSGDQVAMRTADSVEAEAGVAGDAIPSTPSIAEESPL
ncbi:MAG: anti-sigma factor family protein, partial [Phycisphaerae bacterium]